VKVRTRIAIVGLVCLGWLGAGLAQDAPTPQQETLANMEKSIPEDAQARFYRLGNLAKAAYAAGEMGKAENYANELLSAAPNYTKDWNYGNAIFAGNTVAGLVVLKRDGNVSQAEGYLLASARNPGSPQLGSFGPSMRLAQELLSAGKRDTVLDFLRECGKFWKSGQPKLNSWIEDIQNGKTPDFGPNLTY
jgi:hypothetical protein